MADPSSFDSAGSFWSTFSAEEGASETTLQRLLQEPDCSVAALLDEEDVIQEFKSENEALLARLVQPDAVTFLIQLLTEEPPASASANRCYREPFVASELLSCGATRLSKALTCLDANSLNHLDQLWALVEATPLHGPAASQVNVTILGYFSRVLCALMTAFPAQMCSYFESKGAYMVWTQLVARLRWTSFAEVLVKLMCQEQEYLVISPSKEVIMALLKILRSDVRFADTGDRDLETQECQIDNVSYIFSELLGKVEAGQMAGSQLMQLMTSPEVVEVLMSCALEDDRPPVVTAALSVLSSVVFHSFFGGGQPEQDNDEDKLDASEPEEQRHPYRLLGIQMLSSIRGKFPRVRSFLDRLLAPASVQAMAVPIGAVPSVGSTPLGVINFLAMLASTDWLPILAGLREEDLLARCLEIFFKYPWNSLLHNSTLLFFSTVLNVGNKSTAQAAETVQELLQERRRAINDLVVENGLIDRIVAEYREEDAFRKSSSAFGGGASSVTSRRGLPVVRVGYMGHLHDICWELRSVSGRLPDCKELLDSTPGWADVVLPALDATAAAREEPLGGGVTEQARGMASSSQGGSGTRSTELMRGGGAGDKWD